MSTTTKVFVGNLSFKTKENELAAEFSSAGKVVSANIITRGPRSLGYGFVELENDEAAQKSVQLLNKKTIDGREINVEVAKPRDEAKIAEKKAAQAAQQSAAAAAAGGEGAPRGRGGRGRGRGRGGAPGARRGGFRGGRGGRTEGEAGDAAAAPAAGAAGSAPLRPRRRPARPAGSPKPAASANAAARTPSQTTLFVANLPFSIDDAGLLELFKEFNVSKAHVVRKRNNRSKGFGFVEFSNEADQQKALSATDKKTVQERELIVKVALTENKVEGADAPAAAAAPPATTPAAAEGEAKQQ